MKKFMIGVGLVLAALLIATPRQGQAVDEAKLPAIGATLADFTLPDTDGQEKSFAGLKGKKGTVVFFTSARCPMVVAYHERIQKIAQDYQAKGINFIGINSNVSETAEEIKEHAVAKKLQYVVLRDAGNKVADNFSAQVTPEMFLFDADNKLVYHGGVDDNRTADQVKNHYLSDALDALLAGKDIARSETKAFGCTVKRAS